jgi:hypothetical protein
VKKSLESDAVYRRYVELSKTASRVLLILISIALYTSLTIYKNWDVETKEDDVKLPLLDATVTLEEFFVIVPIMFFILSVFYWVFLAKSLDEFRAYCKHQSIHTGAGKYRHPCLYELPIKRVKLKMFWQGLCETFPIWFLFLLLPLYLGVRYLKLEVLVLTVLLALPIVVHMSIFRIRIQGSENVTALYFVSLFGVALTAFGSYYVNSFIDTLRDKYALLLSGIEGTYNELEFLWARWVLEGSVSLTDVLLFMGSFGLLIFISLFFISYTVSFIRLISSGEPPFRHVFFPILLTWLILTFPLWVFKSRVLARSFQTLEKLSATQQAKPSEASYGYVGYFTVRYRELKRMQ